MRRSWKVQIKTKGDDDFVDNELRFGKKEDAAAYAADLYRRWTSLTEFCITGSDDEPNATFPTVSDRYRTSRGPPSKRARRALRRLTRIRVERPDLWSQIVEHLTQGGNDAEDIEQLIEDMDP